MPCYFPLQAWRSPQKNESGKSSLVFKEKDGHGPELLIACGQCHGCRLDYARQWAIRCVHEASLHEENCYLTLTYSDEHLPENGSLTKGPNSHFTKFMKTLREDLRTREEPKFIRFFQCGEYGDNFSRPHHHVIIFGYHPPKSESEVIRKDGDYTYYTCDTFSQHWKYGYHDFSNFSFNNAAYVARYLMKKITGEKAEEHYQGLQPEYITMSRNPGIAADWFKKFQTDLYPSDNVVINGKKMSVPKFYDKLLEEIDPNHLQELKKERRKRALSNPEESSSPRLRTKEHVAIRRQENVSRTYDQGE